MLMPTFEIEGPDSDGDWWVIRNEMLGNVMRHTALRECYPNEEEAQAAADSFNADPGSAPIV